MRRHSLSGSLRQRARTSAPCLSSRDPPPRCSRSSIFHASVTNIFPARHIPAQTNTPQHPGFLHKSLFFLPPKAQTGKPYCFSLLSPISRHLPLFFTFFPDLIIPHYTSHSDQFGSVRFKSHWSRQTHTYTRPLGFWHHRCIACSLACFIDWSISWLVSPLRVSLLHLRGMGGVFRVVSLVAG